MESIARSIQVLDWVKVWEDEDRGRLDPGLLSMDAVFPRKLTLALQIVKLTALPEQLRTSVAKRVALGLSLDS